METLGGMTLWPDVPDWLGGYPFEVAKAEEVNDFHKTRGFTLVHSNLSKGGKGRGNNQYVFVKGSRLEHPACEAVRVA